MRNNNRLAILFLTNHSDLAVVERIKQLMQATSACRDVYVLFNLNDGVQAIPDGTGIGSLCIHLFPLHSL